MTTPEPSRAAPGRGRLVGVALVSAAVLLLQLVQTRVFSYMLWHHLTYLVVTFTLLGFAAGGAALACRRAWIGGDVSRRLGLWGLLFGLTALGSYALITRIELDTSHTRAGIFMAAVNYAVLVVPMVFGGLVVALALTDAGPRVGQMYAWNMGGSALGCAIYVPILRVFGGEGTIVVATALAFGGAWSLCRGSTAGRGLGRLAGLAAAGALIMAALAPTALFTVPPAKSKAMAVIMGMDPSLRVEHTVWDPVARLDVVGPGPDKPRVQRTIFQDADAPSVLPLGAAHENINILAKEGLAYLMFQETAPKALAIGIGGGIDVLQGAAEKRVFPDGSRVDFTGVELNASMAGMMRGKYAEPTRNRYHLPGVSVHVGEGRSWLRRSDQQYDIIQMTGTDTYTALSSGSYVMSESYLYTLEAYDDFLDHLTDDGVICVLRFRFEPPRETLRLAAIMVEALREDGVEQPENHVVMLGFKGHKQPLPDGSEVGIDYGMLLLRKQPFSPDQVNLYERFAAADPQAFMLYAPGVPAPQGGEVAAYFDAVRDGTDRDFRAAYVYDVDPVRDDNPFFFRYHRWERVWSHWFGGEGEEETSDRYAGIVGGEPIGLIMLLTVLGQSAVLVVLLVLVPLLLFRREGLKVTGAGRWTLYFFGLGAGYMLVEVAVMQRFVLFLGHPGYAITVVLVSFLVFSGLGASVAGRSNDSSRTLTRALIAVVVLVLALMLGLPSLFDAALLLPLWARILVSIGVLGPLAFVMGMPFPSGLALLSSRSSALVPWAFGINGGASVIASVAGILIAMAAGFTTAFLVAAASYAVALLAGRRRAT